MFKTKTVIGLVVVLTVLFMQVGSVFAAPATQDGTISGDIVSVEQSTPDANGDPTYLVTVNDGTGEQTVRVSYDTAVELGLFVIDPNTNEPALDPNTGDPVLDLDKVGTSAEIPQDAVIPDEEPDEEPFNPVAGFLADYFGVTNATINQFHEDGYGFGVIAQALWMASDDDGNTDAALAEDILLAKQSKDYETFFANHPEYAEQFGDNVPANWGQFKKVLSEKHENLGTVVSGHGNSPDDANADQLNGSGNNNQNKNKNKGNNGNNGHGHGHGHGQP